MAKRTPQGQTEHDAVVEASGKSYAAWRARGYEIDINPDGLQNRSVGPSNNPRYPDVVVWIPEHPGASRGKADVIEEIETANSVTEQEAGQWADYASLGVREFNLVVPREKKKDALAIIQKKAIRGISKVQGYYFSQSRIYFE